MALPRETGASPVTVALLEETGASPVTVACQLWLFQGRLELASRGSPKGDWGITYYRGLPAVAFLEETGASPVTVACQPWLS